MERESNDRVIRLGEELPLIPERLLLAHARGEVLFICGAGISMPAGLPNFHKLVLCVYKALDPVVYLVIKDLPRDACNKWEPDCSGLTQQQAAEVRRFVLGDYDVVLGMLERRLDDQTRPDSSVRHEVSRLLRMKANSPAPIHQALIRLADRGGATTIVTTNFDLLLESAAKRKRLPVQTYSLGSMPRPTKRADFAGVLHIHGALDMNPKRISDLVLSDQDFGEFYLRRRVVPDFIYDAARLFHLVLVGYSADDPPMRYLLNAVAADGNRFSDLEERFTFFSTRIPDPVAEEDWKARGITPIPYNEKNNHDALRQALQRWAELSAINGRPNAVDQEIRQIVKAPRATASEASRDLFDHFLRRSNPQETVRLAKLTSNAGADMGWLDAIVKIRTENAKKRKP